MADLLGLPAAKELQEEIINKLEEFKKSSNYPGRLPKLAIVRVGERADDLYYEKSAVKKIDTLGMETSISAFPANIKQDEFLREFSKINEDDGIDGILMFSPLPNTLNEKEILDIMKPEKDLDGLTKTNQVKVYLGERDGYAPCTAAAVMQLLKYSKTSLAGKNVVVIGRSAVIGKPVSMLLLKENATVTICHSKTDNIEEVCKRADVLVAAVGRAKMVTDAFVKNGAVVIDVGINQDSDGNMCGDVDYDKVAPKASLITPVPRGVGSVTTTILASHLLDAAIKKTKN